MQLRGWGQTRAILLVIILLVVQHLQLGLVQAFVPASTTGATLTRLSPVTFALDIATTLAIPFQASRDTSAILGEPGSRAIPPDPAPFPRRLPRAPPAA